MTRRRLSVALVVLVLLGASWADAAAQTTAEEVAATRQRAEQGDAIGQFLLGYYYEEGDGVLQDYVEALKWFRLAADQGQADAQTRLGMWYSTGRGVPQDDVEAVRWLRLAAEQGNADAQARLGGMYFNGDGVLQDYVEAHKWFNLGTTRATIDKTYSSLFLERYRAMRDGLAKRMTPAQLAEAQTLAREWQAAFDARQE